MSIRLELRRLDVLLRAAALRQPAPGRAEFLKRLARSADSPLAALANEFQLSALGLDLIVLALAPEIDLRYADAYATLTGAPARRGPDPGLALQLFAATFALRVEVLRALAPSSPLFRCGLLESAAEDPCRLAATFRLSDWLRARLLDLGPVPRKLDHLADRVPTRHAWDDLVLPVQTIDALRQFANAARHRYTVAREFTLGRLLNASPGVAALFAGPSGTGKTLSASVVAAALELPLYRIDLARVVSKYIGETEKNLDQVFQAAAETNGILFFDEAEALFGKRSEVRDAHDRYANIEIAYLLQKMEVHHGVVILATNLPRVLDNAFLRRILYTVEFPAPDDALRLRLWMGMLGQTSATAGVDVGFLASQFKLTGGQIRNAVLHAAYAAAGNGRRLTTEALVRAVAGQFLKEGRSPSVAEFKQYYDLISPGLRHAGQNL